MPHRKLFPEDEAVAAAAAVLEAKLEELSRLRRDEEGAVTVIRNARLLRGPLPDEDERWRRVAALRAAQAAARAEASALRARVHELQGQTRGAQQRSALEAKRAEEESIVASIREARVAGRPVAGDEDALWARVGELRAEQTRLRFQIRSLRA
jgi:hypothetical protein